VDFLGFVPYTRIEDHFDEASIFVNTSESEGFPNTFLQAWSRAVPTISFIDCGARHGGQAIGRRVTTLDEMISEITQLVGDEGLRSREGERCRKYFLQHHSMGRALDKYERIFADLMGTADKHGN
jgi:glycosyltransferase involved in cell wall biosynthesis